MLALALAYPLIVTLDPVARGLLKWLRSQSSRVALVSHVAGGTLGHGLHSLCTAPVPDWWPLVRPRFLLYLPPVLIPLSLLVLFGSSLRSGQEPLVSRIARFERGTLSDDLAAYTRRLTLLWSLLFVALTISRSCSRLRRRARVSSRPTSFTTWSLAQLSSVSTLPPLAFRHLPTPVSSPTCG